MIKITEVNQSDKINELIELYAESFGKKKSENEWEWTHIQNPQFSNETEVIVALDKNEIVGARPFMYTEMWINNKKVKAAQHCDTMVHPKYQRKGIFSKMGKYSIKYLERKGFELSYGFPNELSRKGFLKQGYKKLVETETLFKILNPQIVSSKIKNRFLA
ncbi:GNAT family N-acetyltransferase, partial [Thermoproteota archaeon]